MGPYSFPQKWLVYTDLEGLLVVGPREPDTHDESRPGNDVAVSLVDGLVVQIGRMDFRIRPDEAVREDSGRNVGREPIWCRTYRAPQDQTCDGKIIAILIYEDVLFNWSE